MKQNGVTAQSTNPYPGNGLVGRCCFDRDAPTTANPQPTILCIALRSLHDRCLLQAEYEIYVAGHHGGSAFP